MLKKYAQIGTLAEIFDLSPQYFKKKKESGEFVEGVHYIIPPTTSKTKKAVLFNVEAVENWLRGNQVNSELDELLSRNG